MPPMCLVPHCSTGSRHFRSVNQTYPMFTIPKDENLKKKWEKAIPGDIKLRFGQVVCAKHFLKSQVITEFELKDKLGNVIGKQTYKRARLKEKAVPSIFEMPICIRKNNDDLNFGEHNYSVICRKSPNHLRESSEDNFNKVRDASDVNNVTSSNFHVKSNNYSSNENSDCTDFYLECTNSLTNESNFSNLLHNAMCESDKIIRKQNNEQNNTLQVYYKTIICINDTEIEVPNSWSIIQKNINNGLTLIFTHSVSIMLNELENKDKIKKYVIYNCSNGNARYFAHGKEVIGVYEDHLLPRLSSVELLITTLLKFEKMRMCSGLKKEFILDTFVGEYYVDNFNIWRTKQCTLLTRKFKTCIYCSQLMIKLFQRKFKWKNVSNFHINTDFEDKVD